MNKKLSEDRAVFESEMWGSLDAFSRFAEFPDASQELKDEAVAVADAYYQKRIQLGLSDEQRVLPYAEIRPLVEVEEAKLEEVIQKLRQTTRPEQ